MTLPSTEIDKIGLELHELAEAYAKKAATLASDPYFKEAIIKVSVSGFVWALYRAFDDAIALGALNHELKIQSAAIDRAVGDERISNH